MSGTKARCMHIELAEHPPRVKVMVPKAEYADVHFIVPGQQGLMWALGPSAASCVVIH